MAASTAARRLRVLHLVPDESLGGIATYGRLFRRSLRAAGVDVDPLEVRPRRVNAWRDVAGYIRRAQLHATRGYDIVHAELGGGSLREFYATWALGRRGPVPICVTLHDPPRPIWRPFHSAVIRDVAPARGIVAIIADRPALRIERRVLALPRAVFTLSRRGADAVAARFPEMDAARVLPYPAVHAPTENQAGGRDASPRAGELVIGFYGHWYRGKGIERLLEALRAARDEGLRIRAHLWGGPPPGSGTRTGGSYRGSVVRKVESLGLGDSVTLPGPIPAGQVAAALRRCDVIVLPYEAPKRRPGLASTSGALHETLAAGVPVIATNARALGEAVDDGRTGLLVPPGDTRALLAALRRLHDHPALRAALRRGAQEYARQQDPAVAGRAARKEFEAVLSESTAAQAATAPVADRGN